MSRWWEQARWALGRGAYGPPHLASYARMAAVRAAFPDVTFLGPVFIRDDVVLEARRGYGRIVVGPWAHFGSGSRIRCHEGTLRIGAKTVVGARCTINAWLDVEIGDACLLADDVYICDFDHRMDRLDLPIKDQGIVKSPVRIGDDVWLGTKTTVLRGTRIGAGSATGAAAVVRGDFPAASVIIGAPARVVRSRDPEVERVRRAAGVASPRTHDRVRALVVDPSSRVLMVRYVVPDEGDGGHGVWTLPGGVVEAGQSAEAALAREVEAATGLRVGQFGAPVWVRELAPSDERHEARRESYYLVDLRDAPPHAVEPDAADVDEAVDALDWWTVEELAAGRRLRLATGNATPTAETVALPAEVLGLLRDLPPPRRPWRSLGDSA